jgi:ABC-type sugar transport system ATPase subunit
MLQLIDISKNLGNFQLQNINLDVREGEYLSLIGASGSGKSLLFELIAGLLTPDRGKILFQDKDITFVSAQNRPIGIVFQESSVFPHLTVSQNIEYPLKNKKLTRSRRNEIVRQLAYDMEIENLLTQNAASLSGGEKQRLALARVLAYDPPLILLDEPLSALDDELKAGIRRLLKKIHQEGKTILHISHDIRNASLLSDRQVFIQNGKIFSHQ